MSSGGSNRCFLSFMFLYARIMCTINVWWSLQIHPNSSLHFISIVLWPRFSHKILYRICPFWKYFLHYVRDEFYISLFPVILVLLNRMYYTEKMFLMHICHIYQFRCAGHPNTVIYKSAPYYKNKSLNNICTAMKIKNVPIYCVIYNSRYIGTSTYYIYYVRFFIAYNLLYYFTVILIFNKYLLICNNKLVYKIYN